MVSFTDSTLVGRRLGTYIAPQNATPGRLRDLNRGTFAYTISHMEPTFYQTFIEAWLTAGFSANRQQPDSESAFARTISMVALNPLRLGLLNSTVTAAGTIGNVHRRIADVGRQLNLSVYRLTSVSPFPLITGNILDSTEAMFFYPFEMTPLYAGSPCNFSRYTTGVPKGGGLVENLGFNARLDRAPAALQVGRPQTVSVTSRFVQPLAGQVSVSGGIMAIELQHQIQGAPGQGASNSIASGQPVYDMFNFQDYSTERFPFGDGGYTDNQGLIAMLRRKVRKILLFYAVASPTTDKNVWSMANSGLSLPFGRCMNCYTYLNTNITDQLINNASRVFEEQHEFDRLFDEYQGNRCNGTVNYFRANLTVMENTFLGVPGGWQAEVFIIMNAEVKKWEDLLADPTKALLNRSRTDPETLAKAAEHPLQTHELVNFPFFPINIFRYDSLAVSALTNFATWHVMELQQQLREFVNSAETTN